MVSGAVLGHHLVLVYRIHQVGVLRQVVALVVVEAEDILAVGALGRPR